MSFYETSNNSGGGGYGGDQQNNGGGGGGFFGTPSAGDGVSGTPDFNNSQTKSGGGRKKDRETLVPVTVRMINQAEQDTNDDAIFRLDGHEFSQVRLVGCIVEVKEQSTNIMYVVEDGSGRIEVKIWLDTEQEDTEDLASSRAKCSEGVYIRVIGNVKVFNEKRQVTAFNVRPIDDFNEVTHHAMESIYCHLKATKGAASAGAGGMGSTDQASASNSGMGQSAQASGDMSGVQNDVLAVFNAHSSDETGLAIKKAIELLVPKGHNGPSIRKAIGFLTDEGHLYSTVDENHLKSTDCA